MFRAFAKKPQQRNAARFFLFHRHRSHTWSPVTPETLGRPDSKGMGRAPAANYAPRRSAFFMMLVNSRNPFGSHPLVFRIIFTIASRLAPCTASPHQEDSPFNLPACGLGEERQPV
ncbi:hypothetical protein [Burkholderia sp. BCC1985]|uniref:hypothetical protein n=1 Tax=Burkholderia sp. BCC1985 TaxID=2817442 RepID=UPI002AAFD754|nr:hypothetical protein [Burkholderia sp. BCC1985]